MYTAESVREELPEVPILFDGNRVLARTYGRCLEFAQVVYQGFTWFSLLESSEKGTDCSIARATCRVQIPFFHPRLFSAAETASSFGLVSSAVSSVTYGGRRCRFGLLVGK